MNHGSRETPKVTVDIIIEVLDWVEPIKRDEVLRFPGIVLIERHNDPKGVALPGGFVDVGEKAIDAAIREALEETTLHVTDVKQFHTYTSPGRDPRGHGITIVYTAKAIGMPKGQDDAKEAFIVNPMKIDTWIIEEMCFDHREIITDYLNFKINGELPERE